MEFADAATAVSSAVDLLDLDHTAQPVDVKAVLETLKIAGSKLDRTIAVLTHAADASGAFIGTGSRDTAKWSSEPIDSYGSTIGATSGAHSDSDGSGNPDVGCATNPDSALGLRDGDATAGLVSKVRRREGPDAKQPLRNRCVEAAGHGIFANRTVRIVEERPHFDRCVSARRIQPKDSDVKMFTRLVRHRDVKHTLRICQLQAHPAGAIVDPMRCHDVTARQPEQPQCASQRVTVDRPVTDHRRSCEGEARVSDADLDQPGAAFLHDHARLMGNTTSIEPRSTRPECRVAGEWQLGLRLEDPNPVVGSGLRRLE
jgi:hypothetical protein